MRFHGVIGFTSSTDNGDGIWIPTIVEREYTGDVLTNYYNRNDDKQVNDNIRSNNRIEIISDDYAQHHHSYIKYAELYGILWEVSGIDVSHLPRIVLTLGEPYGGPDNEGGEDNG
jgi:hypothetical protein